MAPMQFQRGITINMGEIVTDMLNWYLIYIKSNSEDALIKRFSDIGLDVLNPMLKERRFVRGKLQEVISPLFPCYMFVKLDILKDHQLVKYTRGVKRFVGSEKLPAVVPDEIVLSIENRMVEGIITAKPIKFEQGDEVFLKGGPLQGIDAVFEKEFKGTERVSILLKTINIRLVVNSPMIAKR